MEIEQEERINFWEDYLVEDIQNVIFASLPMTPQLCLARTCKREWARRGMDGLTFLHLCLAPDVVQGRTPLTTVKRWALALQKKDRVRRLNASQSLAEALAGEGWEHDVIWDTCRVLGADQTTDPMDKRRIAFHERHITCDILKGYIRGNFIRLFAETWQKFVTQHVLEWPRPFSLFEGRLYNLAAKLGRRNIILHLVAWSVGYSSPVSDDDLLRSIKRLLKALWTMGQFEWFQETIQGRITSTELFLPSQGSSTATTTRKSPSFESILFGIEAGVPLKYPSRTLALMIKYMNRIDVFDHRFVDYILAQFPDFLDICAYTKRWEDHVWQRGRLEDLQWLANHELLTYRRFLVNVFRPIWQGIGTRPKPWPRHSFQRRGKYAEIYISAEQYLTKNPVTQFLQSLGCFTLLLKDFHNENKWPGHLEFLQNLRPDMREWLLSCESPPPVDE